MLTLKNTHNELWRGKLSAKESDFLFFFLILLIKTMSDVDLEIQNTTFEFILLIEDFSEICRHIFKTIYFETIFIIRGIVFSLLADLPSPVLQAARGQHSVVPGRHFIT